MFIHGFLSHLELAWEETAFESFFESLGQSMRVILFDKRGVGLSDRIQGAPTLENTIEDVRCILAAVRSKRTFVLGTSEGGAAAVLLASTYPELVEGLILYASTPKLVRTGADPPWAETESEFTQSIERMERSWGQPWALEFFAPSRTNDVKFRTWWAKILRTAASPSSLKAVFDVLREVDIRAILPQVRVKTLVVHKSDDLIVPVEAGRYFADHMPHATWLELPGADHIYFIDSKALIAAIKDFCQEPALNQDADSWIATILYIIEDRKDSAFQLSNEIKRYKAKYSDTIHQGVMALFESPSRAVQCALELSNLSRKISLHVGECRLSSGKPTPAVMSTSRFVAEIASPGEVILTQTLRDILAGSGLIFEARLAKTNPSESTHAPVYTIQNISIE